MKKLIVLLLLTFVVNLFGQIGTITKVDSLFLSDERPFYPVVLRVAESTIYAVLFENQTDGHVALMTFSMSSAGVLGNAPIDSVEIYGADALTKPVMQNVAISGYIFIAYCDASNNTQLETRLINTSTGDISNAAVDSRDSGINYAALCMDAINDSVFIIGGQDSGTPGVFTVKVHGADGDIENANLDAFASGTGTDGGAGQIMYFANGFGIHTCQGTGNDGYFNSFAVNPTTGALGADYANSYEFNNANTNRNNPRRITGTEYFSNLYRDIGTGDIEYVTCEMDTTDGSLGVNISTGGYADSDWSAFNINTYQDTIYLWGYVNETDDLILVTKGINTSNGGIVAVAYDTKTFNWDWVGEYGDVAQGEIEYYVLVGDDGDGVYLYSLTIDESYVAGWEGKVNGVTNPAKVNSVLRANIEKVNSVD